MKITRFILPCLLTALLAAFASCGDSDPKNPSENPEDPSGGGGSNDKPTEPTGDIFDVPDVSGMNIKGVVYAGEKTPLAGVTVSDGVSVTVTDDKGHYYLNSRKEYGYVFVTNPEGYMFDFNGIYPKHYQRTSGSVDNVDRLDFKLNEANTNDYVFLAITDVHLANRNADLDQFVNNFVPDVKALADEYKAKGKKVYAVTMGDLSWDLYWHQNNFGIPEMQPFIEKIDLPMFNCMGNHDNNPYISDDFLASQRWRDLVGPNFYSFNIGKAHFVVLDDIVYTNPGASEGTPGTREYDSRVPAEELAWLRADLANVKDKTAPVFVLTHIPVYQKPKISNGAVSLRENLDNTSAVAACFAGFNNVTILTGHTHYNYVVDNTANGIREYNVAAACASWWYTGQSSYAKNHICRDGSVGGYRVVEVDGTSFDTWYKSMGKGRDYQFRTYDLNESQITAAKYCPKSTDEAIAAVGDCVADYVKENKNNEVLINVFAWDPRWKLTVKEGSNDLTVTRVNAYDPLHFISGATYRLNKNASVGSSLQPALNAHMFKVRCASSTSTLTVTLTDEKGRSYTQTMTRPKALAIDMD